MQWSLIQSMKSSQLFSNLVLRKYKTKFTRNLQGKNTCLEKRLIKLVEKLEFPCNNHSFFCAILRKKLSLKGIEIWWLWVVYISRRLWYFNYLHSTWSSQQLKYQMLPPHKNFQFFIYFIFVPQFKVFVTKSNQFRVT